MENNFIDTTVESFCSKCNQFCGRCFGSEYNQCLTCPADFILNEDTHICEYNFGGAVDLNLNYSSKEMNNE